MVRLFLKVLKMSNISRDHHYIPQFYLKQWSNSNMSHIWEYKLLVSHVDVPEWQLASIKGAIGWHRDLYTGIIDEQEIDEVEHWFDQEIENPAQKIFEKINNNSKLSKQEFEKLLRFIAAQHVRTPASYFKTQEKFESRGLDNIKMDFSELTDRATNYLIKAKSNSEHRDYSKWFPCKIEIGEKLKDGEKAVIEVSTAFTRNMWHFLNYRLLNRTYTCLLEHDWHIIETPPGVKLYTNDDPVAFVNFYDEARYDFNGGWGKRLGNAFYPISPNHFLFTEIGSSINDDYIKSNLYRLTYWMQKITIENAFRSVYSLSANSFMRSCRQRTVDALEYKREQDIWKNWNEAQLEFENELRR